jgi:hypothetical protein
MKQLICKECGLGRDVGRRLCKPCNNKRVYQYDRYTWSKVCVACNSNYEAHRKIQVICADCYKLQKALASRINNPYIATNIPGVHLHRRLAEETLGRKLQTNEVVHHINDIPTDNSLENLMVMSRTNHGKLHRFLDLQRVIWEKSQNENHGNCWNNLIAPITTTWLETTSVKVIKIWEIGQSAAEPLKQGCQEEGSETTLVTS